MYEWREGLKEGRSKGRREGRRRRGQEGGRGAELIPGAVYIFGAARQL